MKKFLLYALTAVIAAGATSCKDDEVMAPINPAEDFDRMPMTMFRLEENTGVSNDPYGMRVITEELNTVELAWYGIEGAAGYEIKYGVMAGLQSGLESDWNDPSRIDEIIRIDDPTQLTLRIKNLEYGTDYRFAIRVLHPDGVEAHHSKWYGYGDGRQWAEQAGLTTLERYNTPGVLNVGNIAADRSAFTAYLDINVERAIEGFLVGAKDEAEKLQVFEEFKKNFELFPEGADDYRTARFKVTSFSVEPAFETPNASVGSEWTNKPLSINDFDADGKAEFRVTGLQENAVYLCNVINGDIPVAVDSRYNTIRKPVYGDPGDAIFIPHTVRATDSIPGETKYQACMLDKIIGDFGSDITLAEGQTFYLEGGKAYFFFNSPSITKGFTLATRPTDLAEGKRAIVYLGGIGNGLESDGFTETAELRTCNFVLGRTKKGGEADCPIEIGEVCFKDIDFDAPLAQNGGFPGCKGGGTGNYFANCVDGGMAVTIKAMKFQNCTFQNFHRGFVRVKSSKGVAFDHFLIENCVFYNAGFYGVTKGGYAFISDGQQKIHKMYQNVEIVNNTFYDWASSDLVGKDGGNKLTDWGNCPWKFKIENNTFINFGSERTCLIFNNRNYPDNFHFSFKNNLFVLAADDSDVNRKLQFKGCDVRSMYPTGLGEDVEIDICNNYSISSRTAYDGDDKAFSGNQFSNNKNSFSTSFINYNGSTIRLINDEADLKIKSLKVNGDYLRPSQLFANPNPPCKNCDSNNPTPDMHAAPADIWNALKYKTVPAELNGIGDPRWATGDPKNCYNEIPTE